MAHIASGNGLWVYMREFTEKQPHLSASLPVSLSHPHTVYNIQPSRQVEWVGQQHSESDRRRQIGPSGIEKIELLFYT